MFTDEEREAIRNAIAVAANQESESRILVVNPPSEYRPVDTTPALEGIAKAVEGISAADVTEAIKTASQESAASTAKTIKAVGMMVVEALANLKEEPEKPEPPEKIDFSPVVEAMDRNTAVLERLIKVMGAPKTLIFDEADPTKPVGVAIRKGN